MELSSEIEEDIRRLNDPACLSDKTYEQFIDRIFSIFRPVQDQSQAFGSFDKRLVSSTLTFIFECVKYDLDESAVRSKLEDLHLTSKARQDVFLTHFIKHLPTIQLALKQNTLEHDRLLDVNWRLDLQLKTNHTDKLFEPIYVLDWTKRERYTTTIDHLQLTCSQQSLQELVEKLKDAQSVLHQMQHQQQTKK